MKKYFFYLMVQNPESTWMYDKWLKVWHDIIEAPDKKAAKEKIASDNGCILSEKVSKKIKEAPDYRIFIAELSPYWEDHWLKVRQCKNCHAEYTLLEGRQNQTYSNYEYCSVDCKNFERRHIDFGAYESNGAHQPVIYKITNSKTQKCYIGKTTQCFTLRWYQHFFQLTETKFHKAIRESQPSDWIFQVLEVIYEKDYKALLASREQYWIDQYDSIQDGYNSVKSVILPEEVAL
jgi:hypothetical protein